MNGQLRIFSLTGSKKWSRREHKASQQGDKNVPKENNFMGSVYAVKTDLSTTFTLCSSIRYILRFLSLFKRKQFDISEEF